MKTTFLTLTALLLISNSLFAQDENSDNNKEESVCMANDTTVRLVAEKSAKFEGGDIYNFQQYILRNIRYPQEAFQNPKMQGKTFVQFVVDWDGHVKDVTVLKSSGFKSLDKEAVRVVSKSPSWTSAMDKGVCVPQKFSLPVTFQNMGTLIKQ